MLKGGVEKRLAKLETNFAKLKNIEKTLKALAKDVKGNSWTLREYTDAHEKFRLDTEKVFKEIKETFRSVENKHKKINKQLAALAQTDGKLKRDLNLAKNTITKINRVFNADTLSRLRSDLSILADSTNDLAKQGNFTLKRLAKIERIASSMGGFASAAAASAKSVDVTSQELDKYASELKKLASQYYSKTDFINSKLNATVSSVADLGKVTEQINAQLSAAQNRLALMDRLKEQIDAHMATISDLKRRLEYLDKVCAKTIVLE